MGKTTQVHEAVAAEEQLLGCILLAPGTAKKVKLDPSDFYRESYGKIWDAAVKCANNGGCDPVLVAAELERRGQAVDTDKLRLFAAQCESPGAAKAYARRIKETAELRRLRQASLQLSEAIQAEDEPAIAKALSDLGNPIRYVDFHSGEIIEACPTCDEKEATLSKLEHQYRAALARVSRLEGKAEQKARAHKLWNEIEAVFDWYRLATGHFRVTFTVQEFEQALPRWKQYGKGRANPTKPALQAICGIAFDPSTTRGKNGKPRTFDKWELLNRNQFSWPDFHDRVPGETDQDWWRALLRLIEGNLK